MRIIILTQNEKLYLPSSFAIVCEKLAPEIVCIVSCPVMSTHSGTARGLWKHLRLFGIHGTFIMACRLCGAKIREVFTQPGKQGPFYSIKQVASAFDIPYETVNRLNDEEFQQLLDKYRPELLVSISCPQVIGKKIRKKIPLGCINVHGAPLPKYRGLMPAFWMLLNGETKTAISVHYIEAKLDDGDIILQHQVDISPEDTWDSLVQKTKRAGAYALLDTIGQIRENTIKIKSNPEKEATYFSFPKARDRKAFIKAGRKFF